MTSFAKHLLNLSIALIALWMLPNISHASARRVLAPLKADGYLWSPPLSPNPESQLGFQLDFNHHSYNMDLILMTDEITFSSIQFELSAEYSFWDALTIGLDVPFLMVYDISSEHDLLDDTGADIGNIKLHARYSFDLDELGIVITPSFRIWLPTNTFLQVDVDNSSKDLHIIDSMAVFEPMLGVGWSMSWLSVLLNTGPKFYALDDADDFSVWGFDLTIGSAPFAKLPGLEFVVELNAMVGMDDDTPQEGDPDDTAFPLAISPGVRYRADSFTVELGFRIGLHDSIMYFGDFNVGLDAAYLF